MHIRIARLQNLPDDVTVSTKNQLVQSVDVTLSHDVDDVSIEALGVIVAAERHGVVAHRLRFAVTRSDVSTELEQTFDEWKRHAFLDAVEEDRLPTHVPATQVGAAQNASRNVYLVWFRLARKRLQKYTRDVTGTVTVITQSIRKNIAESLT